MCGRFAETFPVSRLINRFAAQPLGLEPDRVPGHNCAPGTEIPLLAQWQGRLLLLERRWGVEQPVRVINARAESAAQKPLFARSFRHTRCAVPVSGYYEWEQRGAERVPWFYRREQPLFCLAGLLVPDGERSRVVILTTAARGVPAAVHSRMPAVLLPGCERLWLAGSAAVERLQRLLVPAAAGWDAIPLSAEFNRPGGGNAQLLSG